MNKKFKLSTELDHGDDLEAYDLFNTKTLVDDKANDTIEKSVINSSFLKAQELPAYEVSQRQSKKQRKIEREKTKGKDWFNMPAGELNEQTKNDLAIIKMRSGLHKDRFYKSNDTDTLPKYFQMGQIVDDPIDYFSSRVPKKQQKKTIVEEILEDAQIKKFAKKNYSIIQAKEESKRKVLARISKQQKIKKNKK